MDVDGFLEVLRGLRDGSIERRRRRHGRALRLRARDPRLAALHVPGRRAARGAAHAGGPLPPRARPPKRPTSIGALDPEAIARVREEAWPQPANAEEVHEALLWMGYVTDEEAEPWRRVARRARRARGASCAKDDRWFAVEATRDPKAVLRGRMEALGPIFAAGDDPLLLELESEGVVLRTRIDGRQAWCDRRLLARIHRYTLDRLRREIEPVTAAQFLRFLACWQHVDPEHKLEGPRGVAQVDRASSPDSRFRPRRGRGASCRRACAATGASGSTS